MTTSISRMFHPAAASRVILGIWAHPDDEAYLSAAFMAAAVHAGHRVVVATATRGEVGTADPDLLPPDVLGPLRESSLQPVSTHSGSPSTTGWPTICATEPWPMSPVVRGRRLVSDLLESVDPDLVVTFGPDGLTGHPDHRAVSRWVTEAWIARGRRGELWHAALTEQFLDQWGELCDDLGVWMTPHAPRAVPTSAVVHLQRCDDALAARKLAALRAHASQTTQPHRAGGRGDLLAMVEPGSLCPCAMTTAPLPVSTDKGQRCYADDARLILTDPTFDRNRRLLRLQGQRGCDSSKPLQRVGPSALARRSAPPSAP